MTNYKERLEEILADIKAHSLLVKAENSVTGYDVYANPESGLVKAKQAITSLIKELVAEAIGEDESLVEVHKRNLAVASQFNAVVKSRNSLRHKQRQALKNLLKGLEEV